MSVLMAEPFLEAWMLYRVCWIQGGLGSGKTLLSVALGHHLLRMGLVDGVLANLPTVLPPRIYGDDGFLDRRVIIFDEAWTHLDSRNSMVNTSDYGGYARKYESFWVFPSVHQIDKRMRSVVVWRAARLNFKPFINAWLYRWELELEYKQEGGWFLLLDPERYFGWYDTAHVPVSDGGLEKRYIRTIYEHTKGQMVDKGPQIREYLGELAGLSEEVEIALREEVSR
jgi:hypothetical protein